MALKQTPPDDDLLDSSSSDLTLVTLILGRERLECRLVDVSLEGFGVSVPLSTAWTGKPTAKLLTHNITYPVRIIKQEAQGASYRFTLKRMESHEVGPDELSLAPRWIIHTSRCCTIGLIAALTYCFAVNPGGKSKDARQVQLVDVINYWKWSWQPAGQGLNRRDPAASESEFAARTTGQGETSGDMVEMPAISVSLTAADRSVTQGTKPGQPNSSSNVDPQAQAIAEATRRAQIKLSIQSAQRGPKWIVNSASLPWLFTSTETTFRNGLIYRMTEVARNDLNLFESGLKSLPTTTATDAASSLRRALLAATTNAASNANLEGLPDVRLIRSEDAEIYFRTVDDMIEILRVVPCAENEPIPPARSSSPTSNLPPQSMNR